jgi:exopolysaccharide biosynthesis polyprenyl glycosylphosphotransferase
MTLAFDVPAGTDQDRERRGRTREPRRSWSSPQPFVVRGTTSASEVLGERAWRSVGARYRAIAISCDAMICLALVTTVLIIGEHSLNRSLKLGALTAIAYVLLVALSRGYRADAIGDGPGEFQAVVRAAALLIAGLVTVDYVFHITVPRSVPLVAVPVTALLCWFGRHLQRRRLWLSRRSGAGMMRTIVVGEELSAARVIRDLASAPQHGYHIDGICVPSWGKTASVSGVPVLGAIADVVQVVADRRADVVLVTGASLSGEALRRLSWALGRAGAHLVVVPDLVEVSGPRLRVRPTAGFSLLEVEVGAPRRRLVAKSLLDRVVGTMALIAAAPVIGLAALAVRRETPGGAFYSQTRVGLDGEPFTMWKLRTMVANADARRDELAHDNDGSGPLFKIHDDPRVTRVGKFLRRYSIDELPQLWNVVRGDMSLVGPRPPMLEEVAAYADPVRRRMHVRPGLTGLWQVSGRSDLSWDDSVRLDLRYVDNWSLVMDIMILWKTTRAIFGGAGAY